jgi:hypothetical protein
VPTAATRLPARSTEWSQRAEWNTGPSKSESPGRTGIRGSVSGPIAGISTRARTSPRDVAISQRPPASSHQASRTSWPKRMRRRSS